MAIPVPLIETERLLLRYFVPEDALDLYEILGDNETMQNCEPPYSLDKTREFLSDFCIGRKGAVAAVHKSSHKLIGYILFHEFSEGIYEMGWIFNRSFWQKGYAYEACNALVDYAFAKRNAHKIFAETIDTIKSVALMEKLGMTMEGLQRSHVKNYMGVWTDLYLYGLLKENWDL